MLGAMFSLFFTAFSSFVNKAYLKNNFPTDLSYVSFFVQNKSNVLGFLLRFQLLPVPDCFYHCDIGNISVSHETDM